MLWATWWAWGLGAVVFAIAEVLLPSYIFLGFAIGAGLIAGAVALGLLPGAIGAAGMALVFALVSLAGWIALRRIFGLSGGGQVKTFDRDINDD